VLHQLVATAIGEGDPAAAEAAMRLLVVEVIEDVARQSGTAALTPLRALSTGQSGTAAND
jgi:DNA-binding GntR family transcriptional regulator